MHRIWPRTCMDAPRIYTQQADYITKHQSAGSVSKPSAAVITIWYLRLYALLFYYCTLLQPPYTFHHSRSPLSSHTQGLSPSLAPSRTQIGSVLMACESSVMRSLEERGVEWERAEGRRRIEGLIASLTCSIWEKNLWNSQPLSRSHSPLRLPRAIISSTPFPLFISHQPLLSIN